MHYRAYFSLTQTSRKVHLIEDKIVSNYSNTLSRFSKLQASGVLCTMGLNLVLPRHLAKCIYFNI